MNFKIIACVNEKLALGKDGDLLYHISDDLKRFKTLTSNGVVIMGRKTLESLPKKKGLPNRINIVISRNKFFQATNCIIVNSIEEAIKLCEDFFKDKECFIIGGSSIYESFINKDIVNECYMTKVKDDSEGDVYFPSTINDTSKWFIYEESFVKTDENSGKEYYFQTLKKI